MIIFNELGTAANPIFKEETRMLLNWITYYIKRLQ